MRLALIRWARFFAMGHALLLLVALPATAVEPDHTTYIVALPGADVSTLLRVEAAGGILDHFDGHEARAYVTLEAWERFQAAGIPYRIVGMQPEKDKELSAYPNYTAIGPILAAAEENHPDIARVVSLGKSVQGRELWAIRLSDNPDMEEDEPEFAFIATMHGDEKVGTVLCLNFLEQLLDGYGQNEAITEWIDETVIWLLPLMNPDGYTMGIRWNAHNQDLNRSFPLYNEEFFGTILSEDAPDSSNYEPEVAHVMEWSLAHSFALMANYHSGALVVNYPYDLAPGVPTGTAAIAPDDALFRVMATGYAVLNPPMYSSNTFPGGTTNGSAWYSVTGGMQDWHYRYTGAIDFTLEVSNVKTPAAGALMGLWEDNREAMFAYLEQVHRGIRGVVTDRISGDPLLASIRVNDNPQPVFTDPQVGDYHRLLLPGSYTVRAEAPGFIPYTAERASVDSGAAIRRDIALSNGDVNEDGTVDAVDMQITINAALGRSSLPEADVDGGGVSATDIQHLVNRVLGRR